MREISCTEVGCINLTLSYICWEVYIGLWSSPSESQDAAVASSGRREVPEKRKRYVQQREQETEEGVMW